MWGFGLVAEPAAAAATAAAAVTVAVAQHIAHIGSLAAAKGSWQQQQQQWPSLYTAVKSRHKLLSDCQGAAAAEAAAIVAAGAAAVAAIAV